MKEETKLRQRLQTIKKPKRPKSVNQSTPPAEQLNTDKRCRTCKHVREDPRASDDGTRGNWKAYECGKCESPYWGCLLNVSVDGNKLPAVTWSGCELWEQKGDT